MAENIHAVQVQYTLGMPGESPPNNLYLFLNFLSVPYIIGSVYLLVKHIIEP